MSSHKKMKHDHPGERSPLIDSEDDYCTRQVFKTSVTINNSPIQDYAQTGDLAPPNYKLFSLLNVLTICFSYSILNNKIPNYHAILRELEIYLCSYLLQISNYYSYI